MNNTICRSILSVILTSLLVFTAIPAYAKVTAEEAAKLKTELTPVGAERAGNKEGTIPAWTGGLSKIPEGIDYVAKSGIPHPDPFADDKILFTITAQNVDQYKDKLSAGLLKMFQLHPETWKMHVYPTRRSAAYSEDTYEGTYQNALNTEIVDEYGSVIHITKGFPFPIAKNGVEAIVNFIQKPQGAKYLTHTLGGGIILANGRTTWMAATNYIMYALEGANEQAVDPRDYTYRIMYELRIPGRIGEYFFVMEPANYEREDSVGWSYIPGMRRVRRNPGLFYDGVDGTGGGIACVDDGWMWRGKPDRFDWALPKEKKEMFIPYNNYQIDLLPDYKEMQTPNHPNPKYLRWELHRTWELVATLKEGSRHIYGKRVYYMDEDTWLIGLKDAYDKRGSLWRAAMATGKQHYDVPVYRQAQYFNFDFTTDYWVANGWVNGLPHESYEEIPDDFFTVQNLRRIGKR